MILKELRLAYFPDDWEYIREFHASAGVVTDGYDEFRPPLETPSTRKVIVYFWGGIAPEKLKFLGDQPTMPTNGPVERVNVEFDPAPFVTADTYHRRSVLLEELHSAMTSLARSRGWPVRPLETARSALIDNGLRATWSSRNVSNRARTLVARVEGETDERSTWISVVVENRDGDSVALSERRVLPIMV